MSISHFQFGAAPIRIQSYRRMEIEYINAFGAEFLQARLKLLCKDFGLMNARFSWIDLGL